MNLDHRVGSFQHLRQSLWLYLIRQNIWWHDFSQPFFIFSNANTKFSTNKCEKDPFIYLCSIRQWDSHSWPRGYESPPITTRPGHPALRQKFCALVQQLQTIHRANNGWHIVVLIVVLNELYHVFSTGIPGLFLILFSSFQTKITILTTNICERMSIQYMVLGFEPTTHESPPITNRPGLYHVDIML